MRKIKIILSALAIFAMAPALADEDNSGFGNLSEDTKEPIMTSSDQMTVDNELSQAELIGNVEIVQGDLLLYADYVRITYSKGQSKIDALFARDNVILISGEDRATAYEADYNLKRGTIVMTGNALVRQGGNTVSADRAEFDIDSGAASMSGRVKSVLITPPEKD
jgi:lipopolysaccharide export system protein LptA